MVKQQLATERGGSNVLRLVFLLPKTSIMDEKKVVEYAKLEAILNEESCHTQENLSESSASRQRGGKTAGTKL